MEGTPIIIKKKKVHGHGGHHGGSWKVAYADFVTAMMAFFMVMWIMGLSDDTRAQIQGYFNDPLGFVKNMPLSRNIVKLKTIPSYSRPTKNSPAGSDTIGKEKSESERLAEEIAEKIKEEIQNDPALKAMGEGVEIAVTSEGLQIEFIEKGEIFFELGKAVIRPKAAALIGKIAPLLGQSGRKMLIDGHTDARPYPSVSYDNYNLSADRANSLRRVLMAGGVKLDQILAVRGNADKRLRKEDEPFHFSNRRVSVVLPFPSKLEDIRGLPKEYLKERVEGAFDPGEMKPAPINIAPNIKEEAQAPATNLEDLKKYPIDRPWK